MARNGEGSADFWGIADNQATLELGMEPLSPKSQSSDACIDKAGCTPLEKILSEAVQLLAGPEDCTAALLAGLQARDIQHAWQLKYLTQTDWEKIQIPGGSVSVRWAATNREVSSCLFPDRLTLLHITCTGDPRTGHGIRSASRVGQCVGGRGWDR